MKRHFLLLCLCGLLTAPAFGQVSGTSTNTCAPQPSLGDQQGNLSYQPFAPGTTTDTFDFPVANGCDDLSGLDSVVCFSVTTGCTPRFDLGTLNPADTVVLNVDVQAGGGSCENVPAACDATARSASAGDAVSVGPLTLNAGDFVCLYANTDATVAQSIALLTSSNLSSCGTLPVEIQSFTVDDDQSPR